MTIGNRLEGTPAPTVAVEDGSRWDSASVDWIIHSLPTPGGLHLRFHSVHLGTNRDEGNASVTSHALPPLVVGVFGTTRPTLLRIFLDERGRGMRVLLSTYGTRGDV
ncbi:hypothetical protein, partial [Streptomyces dubilierae]